MRTHPSLFFCGIIDKKF